MSVLWAICVLLCVVTVLWVMALKEDMALPISVLCLLIAAVLLLHGVYTG